MLEKRLKLGGLQVGGPRTAQNPARFRVANNVYQTLDDYYVPRFGNTVVDSLPAGITPLNIKIFNDLPFVVAAEDSTGAGKFYYGDPLVEIPSSTPSSIFGFGRSESPYGIQFVEKNDALFFNIPQYGLYRFDGVHVTRAGVPTAYGGNLSFTGATTTYVRIVQMELDFTNNVTYSGYTQFKALNGGTVDIIGSFDMQNEGMVVTNEISPVRRNAWESRFSGYNPFYYRASGTPVYISAEEEWEIPLTPFDYELTSGCWVQDNNSGIMVAYKIDRIENDKAYVKTFKQLFDDGWGADQPVTDYPLTTAPSTVAGNQWLAIYVSSLSTGNYVFKSVMSLYETKTITVSAPTTPASLALFENSFNIAPSMGDFYDVTSVKFPFPSSTSDFNSASMTPYGELLCISQKNEIYFSDTSLGGTYGMTSALAFFNVGDESEGPIQAICAAGEFLVVSKQFRNRYVSGNLPTANYSSRTIAAVSLGAYSNESMISVNEMVLLLNKVGLWAIYPGGKCDKVSEQISGIFDTFSKTTAYPEELKWDVNAYDVHVVPDSGASANNQWIKLRYDNCRNLLAVLIRGADARGNALVLNLNNGEFYTWDKLTTGNCNDLDFFGGNYYVLDGTDVGHEEKEDENYKYAYEAESPAELIPTWQTLGEPSLEKKVLQVKMWGRIVGDVTLNTYLDWSDDSTAETTYSNQNTALFSHKKRVDSSNALAASVGLKFQGSKFELEGLEIEVSPIQQGMKR